MTAAASKLAICVNPMAGRDVRRLAARASTMTFEAKRDAVARIAAGADAVGVTDIYVVDEPVPHRIDGPRVATDDGTGPPVEDANPATTRQTPRRQWQHSSKKASRPSFR